MLVKVPGKDTATVIAALSQHVQQLPAALRRSLTWDRGLEMAQHKSFTMATDMQVYFCDPQSPWQRGSNENTNGLLRQYLPKNADLSTFSQSELDAIALRLNTRPRQTLQTAGQCCIDPLRPPLFSTVIREDASAGISMRPFIGNKAQQSQIRHAHNIWQFKNPGV